MKRLGLTPLLLPATLFLATSLCAGDAAPPEKPAAPPIRPPVPMMRLTTDEILKRFDKNHDGKLDEDEAADAHEAMLQEQMGRQAAIAAAPGGEQFRQRMLAMFDKNHDGRLDDDERAEMEKYNRTQGPGPGAPDPRREPLLRQFDKNGDGRIDETEMIELEKTVRPRMEGNPPQLQRFDRNGDGKLDDSEWAVAREQLLRLLNTPPAGAPPPGGGEALDPAATQAKLDRVEAEVAKRRAERMKREQAPPDAGK